MNADDAYGQYSPTDHITAEKITADHITADNLKEAMAQAQELKPMGYGKAHTPPEPPWIIIVASLLMMLVMMFGLFA